MSYNTIYTGSFNDILGDQIDIYIKQKDFTGEPSSLLLDGNPLVISYPQKQFTDNILSCGCNINIVNNSNDFFKYDSLFSVPQKSNFIEIIKTSPNLDASIILFQGYVLPEMYSSTIEKNIRVTIPATDQLAQLDRYTPGILVDTSIFRSEEFPNANDLIFQCISDMDVTDKLAENIRLINSNYVKNSSTTVFDNIFFDANNFYDNKSLKDDSKVLSSILKTFYSRIYYNDGKYVIERMPDIGKLNKEFVYYTNTYDPADDWSDVSSFILPNDRINLANHNIISDSATLTFNPGYQNVNVKLNFNKQSNLLDNYYFDFEYLDPSVSSTTKPAPGLKKWQLSAHGEPSSNVYPDASLYASEYHDSNLPTGLQFTVANWFASGITIWNWLGKQFASSQMQLTPNKDVTKISVKYDYSIDPGNVSTNDGYLGKFALRTIDASGNNWWVAKANATDEATFWSPTEYTFDTSIAYKDMHNYLLPISKTIDITGCVSDTAKFKKSYTYLAYIPGFKWLHKHWVTTTWLAPATDQYIGNLYLDIYAMQVGRKWYSYTGFLAVNTHFGNVEVVAEPETYPDIIEGKLQTFNDTITYDIDLFDSSSSLYTNGIYNRDTDVFTRTINLWKEDGESESIEYKQIQKRLLQDLSQMFNKPRYSFVMDVRSKDSSIWTLGNIYTHTNITKDGSMLEFICNGYDYNVKENTYRLALQEYKADDNWRINVNEDVSVYNSFYVTPTDVSFDGDGATNNMPLGYVDVSTNKPNFTIITYDASPWFTTYNNYGVGVNIWANVNNGIARDGSIEIVPVSGYGWDNVVVNIHQDASIYHDPGYSYITVNPTDVYVTGDYGYFYINVYSNTDWWLLGISNPGASATSTSGTGNDVIRIDYPSYWIDVYEWQVNFETQDSAASATTYVIQNA